MRSFTCFWLIVIAATHLLGQADFPENHFDVFTTNDGLPGNIVICTAVDSQGFLWVGTSLGLARYDGRDFRTLRQLTGRQHLPVGSVNSLFADSHGFLWIRYSNTETYRLNLQTYQLSRLEEAFWKQNSGFIMSMLEDPAGNVWFGLEKGLVKCEASDQSFTFYPIPENPGYRLLDICSSSGSHFWVAGQEGIYRFDPRQQTFVREQELIGYDTWAVSLQEDHLGRLWISNWYNAESGLLCYDPQQRQIIRQINRQTTPEVINTDLYEIRDINGLIWMASNSGGVMLVDATGTEVRVLMPDAQVPNSIRSEQVTFIEEDRFGDIWISTTNGLHRLPAHRKDAGLITHQPAIANSLVSINATVARRLDSQHLVLGTLAGLSIYNRLTGSFRNVRFPLYANNTYNNNINAVCPGPDSSFWAGTWSGLYRLDRVSGRMLEYFITFSNAGTDHPDAVSRMEVGAILDLQTDVAGSLWIVNNLGQLVRLRQDDPQRNFQVIRQLIPSADERKNRPICMLNHTEDGLIIGTFNGMVRLDPAGDRFEEVPIRFPGLEEPIAVSDLHQSADGSWLAIANKRPYRIDPKAGEAFPIPVPDEEALFSRILEDQAGGIWLVAENGLLRTDRSGQTTTFFDSKHYLQNNTFQRANEFRTDMDGGGKIYVGGSKGFTVVDPVKMAYQAPAPLVEITGVRYNDRPMDVEASVFARKALVLPFRQNSFSLEFAALGSLIPELNRFAYRINNGAWVNLGSQNSINFTNLPPGNYDFQLKAANSDGVWNETGASLRIRIRPPWYHSWPAWVLYVATLLYLIFVVNRYLLRRRIEQAETLRLKELDGFKSRFFTNITHEFRTPLTVILGISAQLAEDSRQYGEALRNKLNLIKQNGENLLRLINQILDLAQLDAKTLKMRYIQGDVVAYLNYIAESLYSYANTGNVRIKVESSRREILMDYEPEHLRQITYNLLANAIKFTPSGGKVLLDISTTQDGRQLLLRFADTGKGIPAEDLPHIFDHFFQSKNEDVTTIKGSGIGLALTRELVGAMGGKISVQSPTLPDGKGTTFCLSLPITHKALPAAGEPAVLPAPEHGLTGLPKPEQGKQAGAGTPLLLIIEDNPDVLEYISSCLSESYQLDFAYNGRAGIEKAFETLPDIILSDVMMPEKSGLDVLQTLKQDERTSHIPIVLLTAKATQQERVEGLRTGADAYLTKPFYPQELLVVLGKLIEMRRLLQAKYTRWLTEPSDTKAPAPTDTPIEDAFLRKLRAVVEKHLSEVDFDMPQLERALGMSRSQIFRKVKALTGRSPSLFIRLVRLQHGKRLLETSDLTVSEIAYEVGFSTIQYFSSAFLEEFKMRPTEVRQESG